MNKSNIQTKKNSYTAFFRLLMEHGQLSRREISAKSGLSWGTVSMISADLLNLGIIEGFKSGSGSPGRIPGKLIISSKINLCLGIDINILGLTFIVSDLSHSVIYSEFVDLISNTKNDIFSQLFGHTAAIFEKFGNIIYINVSMQGQIDKSAGVSVSVKHFKDWHNEEIVKFFTEKFGVKTFLYHDPDCLMTYHFSVDFKELTRYSTGAVLKLDEGIGMSLVLSGTIYETNNGVNSEIGHTCVNVDGAMCNCGKRGCLEAYFSMLGLTQRYNEKYCKDITVADYASALDVCDKEAVSVLQENAVYLGIAVANLSNVLDLQFLIIDGWLSEYSDKYIEIFEKILYENTENKAEIRIAKYKREAAALGANIRTVNDNLTDILFANENGLKSY